VASPDVKRQKVLPPVGTSVVVVGCSCLSLIGHYMSFEEFLCCIERAHPIGIVLVRGFSAGNGIMIFFATTKYCIYGAMICMSS
jgi:hypothetical protein